MKVPPDTSTSPSSIVGDAPDPVALVEDADACEEELAVPDELVALRGVHVQPYNASVPTETAPATRSWRLLSVDDPNVLPAMIISFLSFWAVVPNLLSGAHETSTSS